MNSSVIPYSDKNTASFMKYEFSSLLAYRSMIDKNRYNLHYTVLVSEPNKYPYNFPRSFAYWRQKWMTHTMYSNLLRIYVKYMMIYILNIYVIKNFIKSYNSFLFYLCII